ncbi:hypothetical protein [Sphingobium sufflavum]|nr:hypothetical protein [Sphingobium sufflavum]
MDPVKFRVAIPAADPPDNVCRRAIRPILIAPFPATIVGFHP